MFHLSIFPTSLTDSFRRRGTGGKMILASWKLFSDSKMTNAFQKLQALTSNIQRSSNLQYSNAASNFGAW
ncbi:MAG: hypothetical protein DMF39_03330 [Verrucomicrobia bacterium]|nr:MAG: hypothetical protein DMF39_03330 [Verrucomicrobiota bacterium]